MTSYSSRVPHIGRKSRKGPVMPDLEIIFAIDCLLITFSGFLLAQIAELHIFVNAFNS